jgi:hypothetical protein
MRMIRMLTAFTEEIDDAQAAISEILEQLRLDERAMANSVGILHCASEFDETDAVSKICERLPFDVVGCTSLSVQAPRKMSQLALVITVLTSDDVRFVSGVSAPVGDDLDEPVAEVYARVIGSLPEKPAMIMPFIPFMTTIGGDEFIEKIDELSGGQVPAFGTVAITNEQDFSRVYTIYNGELYPASLVLLGLVGEVEPRFFSASVSEENILKQKAVVTGVRKNILQTINDMPALRYLESIGLAEGGSTSGFDAMPFVIRLGDGSILTRACIKATPEGGLVLCGSVPVGATFAIATMGLEDIVESTGAKVREALDRCKGGGMLIYSCVARSWTLGTKVMAEHEAVDACLGDAMPYCFAYSGGEIFPSFLEDGKISNHLQNDTMIVCVL